MPDRWSTQSPVRHRARASVAATDSDAAGISQAFVDVETNGVWTNATALAGVGALNAGGSSFNHGAQVNAIACPSSGGCVAGGYYVDATGVQQAFVANESSGHWSSNAAPGVGDLNSGASPTNGGAQVTNVACGAVGSCEAVGSYLDGTTTSQIFAVALSGTTWQRATALHVGGVASGGADPAALSCTGVGSCTLAGDVNLTSATSTPGVDQEINGQWGLFEPIGAVSAVDSLDHGTATALSCSSDGGCTVVGYFDDGYLVGTFSSVVALAPAPPSTPTVTPASPGHVIVHWTAGYNGGSAVTGYLVRAFPGGATCTSKTTSCVVSGLSIVTSYRFSVSATNANGTSPASARSTPAVYPQTSATAKMVIISPDPRAGAFFTILVVGAGLYHSVSVTLSTGHGAWCATGSLGQCTLRVSVAKAGVIRAILRVGFSVRATRQIRITA